MHIYLHIGVAGNAVPPLDPTRRVKNMTVEKIIHTWNKDLEDHAKQFFTRGIYA